MHRLTDLGNRRFVGDVGTMIVHDRWHPDCEACLPEFLVAQGDAVGFEPDELGQALEEGFECCCWCIDKTDPPRPVGWDDRGGQAGGEDGQVGEELAG